MKGEFWGRNPSEAPLAKIPCQDCRGQDKTCFWLSAVEAVGSAPKSGSSVGCCDLSPWRLGSSAPLFPAAGGLAKPGGGRASPQLLWRSERRSPLRGDLEDASWPLLVDSIQDFQGAQVVQKSAVKVKDALAASGTCKFNLPPPNTLACMYMSSWYSPFSSGKQRAQGWITLPWAPVTCPTLTCSYLFLRFFKSF